MTSPADEPRNNRVMAGAIAAAVVIALLVVTVVVRAATRKDSGPTATPSVTATSSSTSASESATTSPSATDSSPAPSTTSSSSEPASTTSSSAAASPTATSNAAAASECARIETALPKLTDWPKVTSNIKADPAVEARVKDMVSKMTLAEKVGQMTQPEISHVTAAQVGTFHIGSVLNGGGSWPGGEKTATPQKWLELADSFWDASVKSNSATKIPVIWGIDAVHGNNNVYGATLFPQNSALGAAHDPCLIRDIAAATAKQVRVTGQDWTFAPVVAVAQDDRWGRAYESYSEDPAIVSAYAREAVKGFQGTAPTIGKDNILSTAKHFLGDGGTENGKDQGVTNVTEAEMMNLHGQGYYSAIASGVQTIMVSYSSWTNDSTHKTAGKMHGSKYAITDVLKNKMGFDGLVISDWNGHGQVDGCSDDSCPKAVNAGIDVFMVPEKWQGFIKNTVAQVKSGEIPMARIDDAVTRILRVKVRAGVFEELKPSARAHAAAAADLTTNAQALARDAVRKSQVLLKNKGKVLPLAATSKVLVVGKSADNIANQTGGWSLTWQGNENGNNDFPNGTTILAGLRAALGDANVTFSENGGDVDASTFDAVVAVIGETPYAEGQGDITNGLKESDLYPDDLAVLQAVSGKGVPVITVLVAGRPLAVNDELALSDAFVVAWLPGTEGAGVSDLLVKTTEGAAGYTGKLSFSWPKNGCQTPLNVGDEKYAPLFPVGYGLHSDEEGTAPPAEDTNLPGC